MRRTGAPRYRVPALASIDIGLLHRSSNGLSGHKATTATCWENRMIQNSAPFFQFGRATFETALTVADITFESTERLVDLQMRTAKETLAQSMRHVKAFSEVRNVQDFVALQSNAARPDLDKALAYSRDLYAVATDAQARIGKILKSRLSGMGSEIITAGDQAARSAPASAAIQSALARARNDEHPKARAARRTGKSAAPRRPSSKRKRSKK